ncbi:Uncharacterised protein [Bordetella pertussis]|nr:Uncharacterised protein [Bordetella pertussis]
MPCSERECTSAPPHHGMNSGYFSTSATRSNIWAAEYGTRTDRWTLCISYRKWLDVNCQ